ncbi:hypothetical protein AVEN_94138-1 [Araneus ventricosus]|uniref:Uncharacterized protein n=1 Tax=Araneus ventricosus TaxID=182803 RepID=A0A4Y2VKC2_ARAVE|nr:hypothetical protein AVEN_94138-1 [Araneus ventricosus]
MKDFSDLVLSIASPAHTHSLHWRLQSGAVWNGEGKVTSGSVRATWCHGPTLILRSTMYIIFSIDALPQPFFCSQRSKQLTFLWSNIAIWSRLPLSHLARVGRPTSSAFFRISRYGGIRTSHHVFRCLLIDPTFPPCHLLEQHS